MRIESIKIENFRGFVSEEIFFEPYKCFIGPNGSGKSTVLNALNVFFRQNRDSKTDLAKLQEDDFHLRNTQHPIAITVTFVDLSPEAQADLSDYYRHGKLVISAKAEYNEASGFAEVIQYGNRLGILDFAHYFKQDDLGASAKDLKQIFVDIQKQFPDLQKATSKPDMAQVLREYEANHPDRCVLIPSRDQFYGISRGVNRLSKFIQWVFVPAVKDPSSEGEETKDSSLGQLLARTVRSQTNFEDKLTALKAKAADDYHEIIDAEQLNLETISKSLNQKLKNWAHPDVSAKILWKDNAEKAIKIEEPSAFVALGERGFEAEISRFGHGLQRSFLLAILQELVSISDKTGPRLILGIEEPELYQHPPQARYLSEILQTLAESDSQVMLCSHNPLFIPGDNIEAIRMIRENPLNKSSYTKSVNYANLAKQLEESGQKALRESGILAKLYPSLNPTTNEMFFCKKLILTEGVEDLAYLETYVHLSGHMAAFRSKGCHIVPVGGKSGLVKPIAIANLLEIPTFVLFDGDTDKSKENEVISHKRDNRSILNLLGHTEISEWPSTDVQGANFWMWSTNITNSVSQGIPNWSDHMAEAVKYYGHAGDLQKNPLAISRAVTKAYEAGDKLPALEEIVKLICA